MTSIDINVVKIIPKPVKIETKMDHFSLNKTTKIIVDKQTSSVGKFLQKILVLWHNYFRNIIAYSYRY